VDTALEESFDTLTWLASRSLQTPIALFTLLTPTRQWFKSRQGVEITETPRSWAFCNHTILQRNVFVVEDLARDAEFVSNPTVAGPPNLRFYAGAPVIDSDGFALDLFASSTTNRARSTKARCKLCLPSRALLPTRSSCAARTDNCDRLWILLIINAIESYAGNCEHCPQ
jgi:GAF domain-containing protein